MDKNLETQLVSVVMPAYNAAGTVRRAVDSVLRQAGLDYELVIVEDGSADGTWEALQAYASDPRVVLLRNERNLGLQRSLNRGVAVARGNLVARIDADDEWVGEDKLARQVAFLREHPDHVAVGTGALVVKADGETVLRYLKPETDAAIRRTILGSNCFIHPTVVMRRAALNLVGGYDESPAARHVEDYDLWLRLGQVGKLANLPIYGLKYGTSSTQIGALHYREQFRKNLALMWRYRRAYPGFAKALVRNVARLAWYGYWLHAHAGMTKK